MNKCLKCNEPIIGKGYCSRDCSDAASNNNDRYERDQQFNRFYMQVAHEAAKLSRCERAKVGAVLVKHGNIIAFGFNGTPAGFCNECEDGNVTKPEVIHAELNAIIKAGSRANGAVLYCTLSPCMECCKLIKQAGIVKVYFSEMYRLPDGLDRLGIAWERITC